MIMERKKFKFKCEWAQIIQAMTDPLSKIMLLRAIIRYGLHYELINLSKYPEAFEAWQRIYKELKADWTAYIRKKGNNEHKKSKHTAS